MSPRPGPVGPFGPQPLHDLMVDRGLTARALAHLAGVSVGGVSGWRRGWHLPSPRSAELVAGALGLTVEAIWPDLAGYGERRPTCNRAPLGMLSQETSEPGPSTSDKEFR